MKYGLLFMLLMACSQTSTKKKPVYQSPKITRSEIDQCKSYEAQVLNGAVGVDATFVDDEDSARHFLMSFDIKKSYPEAKANLVLSILETCTEESVKEFNIDYKRLNECNPTFSELDFFQALAHALKKYRWPTNLNLEGKKVALDYVKFYSEGNFPLLNRLVAMSVLSELSVNNVVNKNLHKDIKKHMLNARTYLEGLRKKLDSDPALTCESLDIIKEELDYSSKLSTELQSLLKRI